MAGSNANDIKVIDMVDKTMTAMLENELEYATAVDRSKDNQFARTGENAKIGAALRIVVPTRAKSSQGPQLTIQPYVEQQKVITINKYPVIGLDFSISELTLSMADIQNRMSPYVSQMANDIDSDVAQFYKKIGNSVGTPGTAPSAARPFFAAQAKLNMLGVPKSQRTAIISDSTALEVIDGMKTLFNPSGVISSQMTTGEVSPIAAVGKIVRSQNVYFHTCGTRTATGGSVSATVTTDGAITISITGAGANTTINAGDVFNIAGCYAVNYQNRTTTGQLFDFVSLTDVTLDGSGAGTITTHPMYPSAHILATMTALPASGAAVTFWGAAGSTSRQNILFNKYAVTLVMADLYLPTNMEIARKLSYEDVMKCNLIEGYDISKGERIRRYECAFGWEVIRPELACRIWGESAT